jgi:glycoprotein endo-alpha-1,2-mannosidase
MIDRRSTMKLGLKGWLASLSGRAVASSPPHRQREVLTFYYGWYATPETSRRWRHWPSAPDHAVLFDHPRSGPYDSHDPALIARHADMLQKAGVTGIISSWWGQGSFEDRTLDLLLDTMHARGISVCAYIEQQTRGVSGAASDLNYLVSRYASHPAWLKVHSRPVIFVYLQAVRALPGIGWREAARQVAAGGLAEPILIGDVSGRDAIYASEAEGFDGTHTYVMAPYIQGMNPEQVTAYTNATYPKWKRQAVGNIYVATIGPGFNDTHVPGRPAPRPVVGRFGTGTFDALWRAAIKTDADWVVVTSFNEWHEGSEIEPSIEHGDVFLRRNREWSRMFLQGSKLG